MTKDNWATVGKVACVSLTVATAVLGYYGVKSGIKFFNKNMAIKKILTESRKVIEKSYVSKNEALPYDEITKKISDFETKLKKLTPELFLAFSNWFNITIPFGKTNNTWNYKEINSVEYEKKKSEFLKVEKELTETGIIEEFNYLEKLM